MSPDAVEVLAGPIGAAPWVVFTVEHASARLPPPWTWPEADAHLASTHWGSDLGIADFARVLAAELGAPAVLARFSRLLIDANRPLDSSTLFRDVADGQPITMNVAISEADRHARISDYYEPYHEAIERMVVAHAHASVVGLHSFTPCYEGQVRSVEIGVLFDHDEASAITLATALSGHGYDVRLNEPWSGRNCLMYGPASHATHHARRCLELEIRQDLLADAGHRVRLLGLVAGALRATLA